MNTFLNRLNIVGLYAITALIVLTLFSNTALLFYAPEPHIGIHNVDVLAFAKPTYPSQYSHIFMHTSNRFKALLLKFDIDLDLRSCLTWGTKQIMVWLVLEYSTKTPLYPDNTIKYTQNQAVIWDYIVQNNFDYVNNDELDVFIEGLEVKYPLSEIAGQIDWEQPMKLKLQWEITPMLGFFSVFDSKNQKDVKTIDLTHKITSIIQK